MERGAWATLIFFSYTCIDGRRAKRFDELQEKVSKSTGHFEQGISGAFGIISRCFSLRAAWSSFFVMPILIIFTDAHIKRVSAGKRA